MMNPSILAGIMSIIRYILKATSSPRVSWPFMTCQPPNQNMSIIPNMEMNSFNGKKYAHNRANPRFSFNRRSIFTLNLLISCSSCANVLTTCAPVTFS